MQQIEKGDHVTLVYDGRLEDGELFESSADTGPLSFTVGDGSVFQPFNDGVIGMKVGESKTVEVAPELAYGPPNPELIQTISRKSLGEHITPKPGMILGMTLERDGQSTKVPAQITKITGDQVTIDYNHPLAGKTLRYEITIQEIGPPQPADNGPEWPFPGDGSDSSPA